jgi:hypothetical protein
MLKLTLAKGEIPKVTLDIDEEKMEEVDIFYTQQGQVDGKKR